VPDKPRVRPVFRAAWRATSASALLLAGGWAVAALGAAELPNPLLGRWTVLRLEASKFLVASARSEIERWPGGANGTELVHVRSLLRYLGNTREHHAYSIRPAGSGLPARWMELDPGKRAREVTVSAGGSLALRRFGLPAGRQAPWPGPWTAGRSEDRSLELGSDDTGPCSGPFDPWALLAHLPCLAGRPESRFRMFSNDAVHVVVARRVGEKHTVLQLTDLGTGRSVRSDVTLARIQLAPGPGEPDPSVFGMDGGITLLVEPDSGALVEIEGRREGIPGTVRFRLTGFSRTSRSRPAPPWPENAVDATAAP
jgi:hypothetical protein